MRKPVALAVMFLSVAACAETRSSQPSPRFVDAVGTPWLIAFKIPVCAASIVLAGPLAAAATLAVRGTDANLAEADVPRALDDGLAQNCGPPWTPGS
jgi:hypothetical protein